MQILPYTGQILHFYNKSNQILYLHKLFYDMQYFLSHSNVVSLPADSQIESAPPATHDKGPVSDAESQGVLQPVGGYLIFHSPLTN